MKRLIEGQGLNSPQEYNRIFEETKPNWQDERRWEWLIKHFKGGYIVDVGCLWSEIPSMVHRKFWREQNYRYLGTDTAEKAVEVMANRYPWMNSDGEPLISFMVDDIYNSKIKDGVADYVVMGEILEHLSFPKEATREAFRLLKPGGVLAISVPLEEEKEPGAVDGERHLFSFNKQDIKDLVEPYSKKVKFKVLGSKWFPYRYCWKQLICYVWKK